MRVTLRETFILVAILLVGGALLMPALAHSHRQNPMSACQNTLKQWGLIAKMYSCEHDGQYPQSSPIRNNWIMDMAAVYPEYLSDPKLLMCPNSPAIDYSKEPFSLHKNDGHPSGVIGEFHPDCAMSLCYIYTGYALNSDVDVMALACSLRNGFPVDLPRLHDIEMPSRDGAPTPSERLKAEQLALWQSTQPLMWDRINLQSGTSNHTPAGANVLYCDGHVEFIRRDAKREQFPVTAICAEAFSEMPRISADCQ